MNRNTKDEDLHFSPACAKRLVSSIPSLGLSAAQKIAVDICYKLQPYCEKINIAGSIRRKKSEPKDIEIICVAKTQDVKDLFGAKTGQIKNTSFIHIISKLGEVVKGTPMGKMMQIKLPDGIMLDLFMPDDFDYYRQYAIRTGSADYAAKIIATGWKKKGWCGSDKGLRKISDCIENKGTDGKSKWKCVNENAELPPIWKSEEEFFNWINVKMLPPHERCV
jgi:DNA polymerase/3'-5' exonuclease PolX